MGPTKNESIAALRSVSLAFVCLGLNSAPIHAFINGQNANLILGQANFTTLANSSWCSPTTYREASGVLYVNALGHQRIFVDDWMCDRVFVYEDVATNGAAPSYVIGQVDFNLGWWVTGNQRKYNTGGPGPMAYDYVHNYLFVTETLNSRVTVWDMNALQTKGMNASFELGQSGGLEFTIPFSAPYYGNSANDANPSTVGPVGMNWPAGVAYDNTNSILFVSDMSNNRVMVFDLSAANGGLSNAKPGDHVLGQVNLTQNVASVARTGLSGPSGLAYDDSHKRLFVASGYGVVVYDLSGGISNGMPARYVIGQPDWNMATASVSQSGMSYPRAVAYDAVKQRLFVTDSKRVLIFDLWGGITNGMSASIVLGQPDFTSSVSALTVNGDNGIGDVSYDPTTARLFAADDRNNRVLAFGDNDLAGSVSICGASTICGTVKTAEDLQPLQAVPVDVFDADGKWMATKNSDGNGVFSFGLADGLTSNATFFVMPALGRTMTSIPLQVAVTPLTAAGAVANMNILGWPSPLVLTSASPGTAVLISTSAYQGTNAPPLVAGSPSSKGFYSTSIPSSGSTTLKVSPGNYYVTCWQAQASKGAMNFIRKPANGSLGPYSVSAGVGQPVPTASCD